MKDVRAGLGSPLGPLASFLLLVTIAGAEAKPPSLEEVRKGMSIPSAGDERGQKDGVGFATTPLQMARSWDLSAAPPSPESLGPLPPAGVLGAICPHDDYLFAARVYRRILPLVTAKTVVVIGVFHAFRKFEMSDALVFDDYKTWRSPDGPVTVSPLREAILTRLPKDDVVVHRAAHDNEHSVEALVYWLKHQRPDVEIVPVIVPAAKWERLGVLSRDLGGALAGVMKERGLQLGRDVAVVVSADAIHYGSDFKEVPFGDGGIEAYRKAVERDLAQLKGPLAGPLTSEPLRRFYSTCVNPEEPAEYRMTWCGRFSIPAGLLTLSSAAKALGIPVVTGRPVAYATSIGLPEIPARDTGLGTTAPSNLYHFVGYPAAAYVAGSAP
ncbi:MAG: hypothetical protein DIJKHBIC_01969 [Thermoanaerobaculia bacterium]|nr:hypothetical protein [Thermoanaerobaculia bacterium]